MKRYQGSMLQGPLFWNIITYTVPIILTSLLHLFFNAADLIVVGRFCGSTSVAAVGATGAITNLIVNLFMGLSVGAGVAMAHAVGSRDNEAAQHTVHTAVPLAAISGGFLTVIGVLLAEKFLIWMGTPEDVLPLSTVYMQIYFGGMSIIMVFNFCTSILRAVGDTKTPLLALTLAGIVNVALNVVFVTVFHMDVAGVALATVFSQVLAVVIVLRALIRRDDACKLRWKEMRFYGPQLKKIVQYGLPAGIQSSLFSISNVVIQSSINSFGDVFMSGSAAASNLEGFAYVCMNSFSQTAVNFVGQNVGAQQYKRVGKIIWICLACVTVTGIITGGAIYLGSPWLLAGYISDSQQAIAYGILRLGFIAVPYFLLGLSDVSTGILRGMGVSVSPMIISVLGICGLRVGWIYTIFQVPEYHTPECLFLSYPVSWVVTFAVQCVVCICVYKKRVLTYSVS